MKRILQIDSSIQGDQSVSRQLTAAIVARLRSVHPGAVVTYRDVVTEPVPQFDAAVATGRAQAPDERDDGARRGLEVLDDVLREVLEADAIVIGAPMYNFGVPSQLKAWLDALAVAGKTFRYGANGPEGLLGGRRLVVASSRGGFYGAGTPRAAFDHQESYLKSFFGFLGITDVEIIRAEGTMMGPEVRERAVRAALDETALLEAA